VKVSNAMPNYQDHMNSIFKNLGSTLDDKSVKKIAKTSSSYAEAINNIAEATEHFDTIIKAGDIDRLNKTLGSYGDFLKQVDKTNLDKLKTSTNMFKEMAKFSESINGNFDKMAETINEKIAPLLEELKESLNVVQEKVIESSDKPTTESAIEKQHIYNRMQETGQTNNLTIEEVDKRIDNKYKESVQQRYGIDEITSKLSELIDLFQNGDAKVKTN
jgi:ABC-type transporter Mla subunit MlaD